VLYALLLQLGGECRHDGYGDHGEGCACIKVVMRADRLEYETLTKDHFKGKGDLFLTDVLKGNIGVPKKNTNQ